jgi:hypothetical protein
MTLLMVLPRLRTNNLKGLGATLTFEITWIELITIIALKAEADRQSDAIC